VVVTGGESIDDVKIGLRTRLTKTVSESDVYLYAGITGDLDPNHVDEEYTRKTSLGHRVAHGTLILGYTSAASTRILQDFGVISRDELKAGRLAGVTKQELIDALYDFLLGLIPLKASAVLIIDEAQNLPLSVLEQIRILSNLETDKEKLLQIILVGQLNLQAQLRSPELRQLDQRVSIRYQLDALDGEGVAYYSAHRLTVAGGSGAVRFSTRAVEKIHRLSSGIPRLINLICDRALLAGFAERSNRISVAMVDAAADSLDVQST